MSDRTMKLRRSIEQEQRRPKSKAPAGSVAVVYTATETFHRRADGSLEPLGPDRGVNVPLQLARATADAEAAFRRSVLDDWPSATATYMAWTDARRREGGYHDVPLFSDVVTQILYSEVAGRNRK